MLRNNLIKKVKDLYAENYKTLVKQTEDDSKNCSYPILFVQKN